MKTKLVFKYKLNKKRKQQTFNCITLEEIFNAFDLIEQLPITKYSVDRYENNDNTFYSHILRCKPLIGCEYEPYVHVQG